MPSFASSWHQNHNLILVYIKFTLGATIQVVSVHQVPDLVNNQASGWLSESRVLRCQIILFENPQIFSSVTQLCPTLCDPMDCIMPGVPVHHQLLEFTQIHVQLSQWCHWTISSSVVPFSSCPQSFPASGSFQMSQLFPSGAQSIGVSASTSVLPMNTQDWPPLGWTGCIS